MSFSNAFGFVLLLQLGNHASARPETACLTPRKCDEQRQKLGLEKFYVGKYQTKGCFSKGGIAYFGIGGNADDKSEPALSGEKERIWCGAAPTQTAVHAGSKDRDKCIDIKVNTGKLYGEKAGFKLSTKPKDGSGPKKLLDYPAGSLRDEREYRKRVCVPEGTYTLTAIGKSSYSARLVGDEVLFGYNPWRKTSSHDIVVGYKPRMNENKREWLDAHNSRREAFHKKHNKKYRPLKWSSALERDASEWADRILPTCEIVREPHLDEGENIATNHYSGSKGPSDNETPANILVRWSDKKLEETYSRTLTQVMWRATRYVGCASKSERNEDGDYCYVHICRYSRPGNCSVRSDNWLDITLRDHTRCGKACPEEGCH